MRLKRAALLLSLVVLAAPTLRAEYVVLRSGQRLRVTGYQLLGDKYRLQMDGGVVEIAAEDVVAIEPEDSFTSLPAKAIVKPPYRELVQAAAARYNVDADLITSVIAVESNFDPKALSRKNARGLMQLLPETAARLGVQDIYDPQENIDAGTRYLRELLEKYNNDLTLAGNLNIEVNKAGSPTSDKTVVSGNLNNTGTGSVTVANLGAALAPGDSFTLFNKAVVNGGVPPFTETLSYVRRVKRSYDKSKSKASAKTPAPPGAIAATSRPRQSQ